MSLSGLDAYLIFHAIKSHFYKPDYDYLKFNGKLRNFDSDRYRDKVGTHEQALYEKLARKHPVQTDLEHFFVANILMAGNKLVIADLNKTEATTFYNQWLGRTHTLTYTFTSDLRYLFEHAPTASRRSQFNSFFTREDRQHPPILRSLLRNGISIESFLILDTYINFFQTIDQRLGDDVIWSKVRYRCNKYRPFVNRLITDSSALLATLKQSLAT
jgi:hypothetical protein